MSLKSAYSAANKYTSRLLQIRYRVRKILTRGAGGGILRYYELHRYATKSYGFLGMTQEAAVQCQADMIAKYTRETRQWEYDSETGYFLPETTKDCMATITATPNGTAWEVAIDVNEDDVVLSHYLPADPSTLFAYAAGRDYDEDDDSEEAS